jgi:hypothetical protein
MPGFASGSRLTGKADEYPAPSSAAVISRKLEPKQLSGQSVGELHLDDDATVLAGFGLEPLDSAVVAIEPFAHGTKGLTEIRPVSADMDDPHSSFPEKMLVAAA